MLLKIPLILIVSSCGADILFTGSLGSLLPFLRRFTVVAGFLCFSNIPILEMSVSEPLFRKSEILLDALDCVDNLRCGEKLSCRFSTEYDVEERSRWCETIESIRSRDVFTDDVFARSRRSSAFLRPFR